MGPISIDIGRLVIMKFQDGWSRKKIAMDLRISRYGVHRILTKFEKHTTLENLKSQKL